MQDTQNSIPDFLICHKCGKAILSVNPIRKYWLIRQDSEFNVVRCSEHITEWSLRKAGIARTRKNLDWIKQCQEKAKEHDRQFVI
jgi:hypothetical protein